MRADGYLGPDRSGVDWLIDPDSPTMRALRGRMLVLVDGGTCSSGESSTLMLRDGLGARVVGVPSMGLLESANVAPYVLPRSGLTLTFPTQWVTTPEPMEFVGIQPDVELDVATPLAEVADRFDELWAAASA
jgi:C-terminal processing protease CtpA/Prc